MSECGNCTSTTDVSLFTYYSGTPGHKDSTPVYPDSDVIERVVRVVTAMVSDTPPLSVDIGSMGPVDDLIDFMEHTMNLMQQMSGQVTDEMYFMEQQIGVMADRIVGTECLIMDMSEQIGIMSDRIVQTEYLMSNMTEKCCPESASLTYEVGADHHMPHTYTSSDTCDDSAWLSTHYTLTERVGDTVTSNRREGERWSRKGAAVESSDVGCAIWDLICIACEEMMKMAEKMEDIMVDMCGDMLDMVTEGALEIGDLADVIGDMENEIMDMSHIIGDMADTIVNTEALMLDFASHFCELSPSDLLSPGSVLSLSPYAGTEALTTLITTLQSVQHTLSSLETRALSRVSALLRVTDGIQSRYSATVDVARAVIATISSVESSSMSQDVTMFNPVKWVELMCEIMDTMAEMAGTMVGSMGHIMDGIAQMTDRVAVTVGDIGQMAQQIGDMAGRMADTEQMMEDLMADCGL
ncbi:hypothetical protein KIPB_008886 [Kipferlia bialata]|uniref:Uncharacterized protein n=1 Tax=Kipferlia bialata TaxID=797122 RepID=A0A9K3D0P7_9EUKA|nr:hypothetical protein KIPB_008886 [Kipferlia bialata]|eukprot:g8886.t1